MAKVDGEQTLPFIVRGSFMRAIWDDTYHVGGNKDQETVSTY